MNEQKNNGRGVFYGVIGVATLVVAIIGATFAYFTASASNNATITGNMATVKLALSVEKVTTVDEEKKGMIPMSNGMVEAAVNDAQNDVCVDDNNNAVCQIYKITLTNDSSAGQFVDGYVALKYGSGTPTDYTTYDVAAKFDNVTKTAGGDNAVGTTMRWAQVFVGDGTTATNNATTADYSTAGVQKLGAGTNEKVTFVNIGAEQADSGDSATEKAAKAHNTANIRTSNTAYAVAEGNVGITSSLAISGTTYNVIGTNYIRVSNHAWATSGDETYDRTDDATSALVFNHNVAANSKAEYYIVVWLSETGTNQTANSGVTTPDALSFFNGNVTFVSAQGSEVSATFSGYSRVDSQATQSPQSPAA